MATIVKCPTGKLAIKTIFYNRKYNNYIIIKFKSSAANLLYCYRRKRAKSIIIIIKYNNYIIKFKSSAANLLYCYRGKMAKGKVHSVWLQKMWICGCSSSTGVWSSAAAHPLEFDLRLQLIQWSLICSCSSSTGVWSAAAAHPLEFDLWLQLIDWSLKYQRVQRQNLQGVSCRPKFECGKTFRTLCLTLERWMGWMVQLVMQSKKNIFFK